MRWKNLATLLLWALFICGCRTNPGQTDQRQNETITTSAQNTGAQNTGAKTDWRQFVSDSPQLILPVASVVQREVAEPQPVIFSECLPAGDHFVPQVTIRWNELAAVSETTEPRQVETVKRFDLGVNYNAFVRNFYSSALSTDKQKRFNIPANSAIMSSPEVMQTTGTSLLPILMDHRFQLMEDSRTHRHFYQHAVVLKEATPGLSTTLRVSHLAGKQWQAEHQFVFTPPVCPRSF